VQPRKWDVVWKDAKKKVEKFGTAASVPPLRKKKI
jgi:hypothetical protein